MVSLKKRGRMMFVAKPKRGCLTSLFICSIVDLVIALHPHNQAFFQINKSPYKQIADLRDILFESRSAGDTVSAKTVLNGIASVYTLTEAQADDLQDVKLIFGKLYGKNIYNLSQNIIDDLEVFAAADPAGYASGVAQTLLRLYGRDYPPIGFIPAEERGQKQKDEIKPPLAERISVFPNPATNRVTFRRQTSLATQRINVEVLDFSGRIVWVTHAGMDDEFIWDTQKMPAGIYFYRILTNGAVNGSGKIILSKQF